MNSDWFKFGIVRGIVSLCASVCALVLLSLFSIPSTLMVGYTAFGYSGGYSVASVVVYAGDLYGYVYVLLWAFGIIGAVCLTSGAMYVIGAYIVKIVNLGKFSNLKNAILVGLFGALVIAVIYITGGYFAGILNDPMFTFVASIIVPFVIISEPIYTYVTWYAIRAFGVKEPTL